MTPELGIDLVRYAHVLCVAIGLGTSVVADYLAFRSLTRPISAEFIRTIHSLHRLVTLALVGMWLSGLTLVYIRTGFVPGNFSPKLESKLFIVTILTLNAILIGRLAIPSLAANVGRSVLDLSLPQMVGAALISGFSTTSWLIALLMGVSKVVAKSGWMLFLVGIPVAYAMSVIASAFVLIALHATVNRMQRRQAEIVRAARAAAPVPVPAPGARPAAAAPQAGGPAPAAARPAAKVPAAQVRRPPDAIPAPQRAMAAARAPAAAASAPRPAAGAAARPAAPGLDPSGFAPA